MKRQLKDLTDAQLKDAYCTVYREAFPPAELKPLSSMRRMTENGVYRNLALFDSGEPVAFANLWLDGDHILIDYLCVPATRRGGGLGAELLERLRELYRRRLGRTLYAAAIHIPYHRGEPIRVFKEWKEDYAHTFR